MKTLVIALIVSIFTPCINVNEVETTQTGTLITYTDDTGYYIGE